jgi:hypothetical protein
MEIRVERRVDGFEKLRLLFILSSSDLASFFLRDHVSSKVVPRIAGLHLIKTAFFLRGWSISTVCYMQTRAYCPRLLRELYVESQ